MDPVPQEDFTKPVEQERLPSVGGLVILSYSTVEETTPLSLAYVISLDENRDSLSLLGLETIANSAGLCTSFFSRRNWVYLPQFRLVRKDEKIFKVSVPDEETLKKFLYGIPLTDCKKWLDKVCAQKDLEQREKERLQSILQAVV